jgi:hypothetical protein
MAGGPKKAMRLTRLSAGSMIYPGRSGIAVMIDKTSSRLAVIFLWFGWEIFLRSLA